MLELSWELFLDCMTDSGLYNMRNATVLVRRIAKNSEVQQEMQLLQHAIAVELEHRQMADGPLD